MGAHSGEADHPYRLSPITTTPAKAIDCSRNRGKFSDRLAPEYEIGEKSELVDQTMRLRENRHVQDGVRSDHS